MNIKRIFRFITNKNGEYQHSFLAYRRPVFDRGWDAFICWFYIVGRVIKNGKKDGYCDDCKHDGILIMTNNSDNGITHECRRGHWRVEAN